MEPPVFNQAEIRSKLISLHSSTLDNRMSREWWMIQLDVIALQVRFRWSEHFTQCILAQVDDLKTSPLGGVTGPWIIGASLDLGVREMYDKLIKWGKNRKDARFIDEIMWMYNEKGLSEWQDEGKMRESKRRTHKYNNQNNPRLFPEPRG